jgi:hypothetical protein
VKDEKQKNPKKSHRGYAFIVYEREKDMKGIATPISHPGFFLPPGIA